MAAVNHLAERSLTPGAGEQHRCARVRRLRSGKIAARLCGKAAGVLRGGIERLGLCDAPGGRIRSAIQIPVAQESTNMSTCSCFPPRKCV